MPLWIPSVVDCQNVVADNGPTIYRSNNVWGNTSPDVIGTRGRSPIGTCVHHTGGTNSLAWLQRNSAYAGSPASADCLIRKDGERYLITNDKQYAYGVGVTNQIITARYAPYNVNEALLSVELEYLVTEEPTFAQVDSLAEQIVLWAKRWGWTYPYVLYGHYGIAAPPGRKFDPYNFEWGVLMGRLYLRSRLANIAGL